MPDETIRSGDDTFVHERLDEWSLLRAIGWRQRFCHAGARTPGRLVGKAHYLKGNGIALCGKNLDTPFLTSVLIYERCMNCEARLAWLAWLEKENE